MAEEKVEEKLVEKKPKKVGKKPVEVKPKQVLKIRERMKLTYVRAKELLYYEVIYAHMADTIDYTVISSYKSHTGSVELIGLPQILRISLDKMRGVMPVLWPDLSDSIAAKIITVAELDKLVPPEVEETAILDISTMYTNAVLDYMRKAMV